MAIRAGRALLSSPLERPRSKMPAWEPFSRGCAQGSRSQPGTDVVKAAPFAARGFDSADFISGNQKYLICIHIHISGHMLALLKSYRLAFIMKDLAPLLLFTLGYY